MKLFLSCYVTCAVIESCDVTCTVIESCDVTCPVTESGGLTCFCAGFHLVALDMPGTGLSSYRPPGVNYHFADYVTDIKRVVDSTFCLRSLWLGSVLECALILYRVCV